MSTPPNTKPKVLLFDVGGVCVLSPFRAILDYEIAHGIPPGYMNFTIRELAPNGSWQKLERGEIPCDATFFDGFKADLQREDMWKAYHKNLQEKGRKEMNPYATARGGGGKQQEADEEEATPPPVPSIDAETLYWTMMTHSRTPDPYMYPALQRLSQSPQFILAGLSNTSIFPADHPLSQPRPDDPRNFFSVFVSSAHVGMRKPARDIYDLTLRKLQERYPDKDIRPGDIVFLDDIGENLKTARSVGWRTIRVWLGKTRDAVRELELVTGLELLADEEAEGAQGRRRANL